MCRSSKMGIREFLLTRPGIYTFQGLVPFAVAAAGKRDAGRVIAWEAAACGAASCRTPCRIGFGRPETRMACGLSSRSTYRLHYCQQYMRDVLRSCATLRQGLAGTARLAFLPRALKRMSRSDLIDSRWQMYDIIRMCECLHTAMYHV